MSVAAVANPIHILPASDPQALPAQAAGENGAGRLFASYEPAALAGPTALAGPAPAAIGQGATPDAGSARPAPATALIQSRELARWHDIMDLHGKVKVVECAEAELKATIARMREHPPAVSASAADGRRDIMQARYDYVVSAARESGLYDVLKQAAMQRLKGSGHYEDLVRQVLQSEGDLGRPRDRQWAENWIAGKCDYQKADAAFDAGEPYIDIAGGPYDGAWASRGNKGTAAVLGDRASVQANGRFDVEFVERDNRMFYTVENRATGEKSTLQPYDARGTIIEAPGLRADMFGRPAPGDVFSFAKPPGYCVRYPEGDNPMISQAERKDMYKARLFDRLFGPFVRGPGMPSPGDMLRARH